MNKSRESSVMTAPIFKLCAVLVLVGIPGECNTELGSECPSVNDITLQPNILEIFEGYTLNFTCLTNLSATYPRWKINDTEYEVTKLPSNFVVRGLSIEFKLQSSVRVCCFIKTFFNRSVIDIYSNTATVVNKRNSVDLSPVCEGENVTITYQEDLLSILLGIATNDCNLTVNVSRCGEDVELPVIWSNGSYTVEVLQGDNITVAIDNDCDDCEEMNIYIPNFKQPDIKAIPSNYTGPIKDLPNNYCDFSSVVIDYKICIHSEELTECFEDPCGNGQIHTSLCGPSYKNEKVSLEVNGVANGTIVSIYCQREDCKGNPSNLMVLNLEILICNSSAEFAENVTSCEEMKCKS
jgi:hypothetical protein